MGEAGLETIIKANRGLGCNTCNSSFMQNADEYIEDVKYYVNAHVSPTEITAGGLINEIKSTYYNKVIGSAFQLRVLRSHSSLFSGAGNITSFDLSIEDSEGADDNEDEPIENEKPSKCRYDVKVIKPGAGTPQSRTHLFEFKSWGYSTISKFLNANNFNKRTQFTNQFKTYLSNISSLDQLHYIFDGRRTYNSGTLTRDKAKEILLRVFRDDPGAMWDLKTSLFNGKILDDNNALITERSKFILFINNPNFNFLNRFLDFVEIY